MSRRIVRHHLVIALSTAAGLFVAYVLTTSTNPIFRWSMATAYVGLALLGATLIIGPLNILRRSPNPASTDLRRDLGIWAGVLSIAHFIIGWQVHMKHRYLYWLREVSGGHTLVPRTDLFGFANYTGLAAVLLAGFLLALSNDKSIRWLGTSRWKPLQRWNYALFALVAAHGIAFQVIETRAIPFIVALSVLLVVPIAAQLLGYERVRSGRLSR
jgi:methionine sulfoxide reductase heme-binding subunit